jgi:excinuclease ABC subunit C
MASTLKETAASLPNSPGVYIMKDAKGEVIYVGKAKDLRKRVTSYFLSGRDVKTSHLVGRISSIEYILTQTEYEALLLENNLIKQWKPRYNINLKDGKSYPVIRITNEEYPRVFRTRRIIEDGSSYFGPFPNVAMLDTYLALIEKLFPLRKCKGELKKRKEPCLYYHIGRCLAPCAGRASLSEYLEHVEAVKQLLSGKTEELLASLSEKMQAASASLTFERAAKLRDAIEAIRTVQMEPEVEDFNPETRDYIACACLDSLCTFAVFSMRGGKLLGRDMFKTEIHDDEAFLQFMMQYYGKASDLPDQVFVSQSFETELILEFFAKERGKEVSISVPDENSRHGKILRMALMNGMQDVEKRLKLSGNIRGLEELKRVLALPSLPRRIEGFDIAQLSGKYPVASLVSFSDGNPDKKNYRRFHIKTLGGAIDDYESIREVVARRYTRVINEGLPVPDLILIDGGKGQVNAAKEILETLGLGEVPVAGLAKQFEEIFLPGRSDPIRLPDTSEALKILQGVRDETHRFATSFNKQLREKDAKLSVLTDIPGIGPSRAAKILTAFGSLNSLRYATPEEIASKAEVPLAVAEAVHSWAGKSGQ